MLRGRGDGIVFEIELAAPQHASDADRAKCLAPVQIPPNQSTRHSLGIVAIAILLIDFFRVKSNIAAIASGMFPGMPGARAGTTPSGPDAAIIQNLFGISWGFFAMVAGGVLLIVAGAMKDTTSTSGTNWDSNVPPSILK